MYPKGHAVEPTLAVIGLNFRTSPVAIRERFWISDERRHSALYHLVRSDGIDEVMVLATCNRTDFILWASDVSSACDSVLRFLAQEYELKLCEWSHFYRLMDDAALAHVFRVASGLDSMVLGEPEVLAQMNRAWTCAKEAGCTGRFLDSILEKALGVSQRVHKELLIRDTTISLPYAAVELAMRELGDLTGREVLLIGAGKMNELAGHCLKNAGVSRVNLASRTAITAEHVAARLAAQRIPFEDHQRYVESADIVVSSTSSPGYIISREQAEAVALAREHRLLVMIDIAVPRDIDPSVREVEGIRLFDIDDLEAAVRRTSGEHRTAAAMAEKIIYSEVSGFRKRLTAEQSVPELSVLRQYLDELCHEELDLLRKEFGPFTADQDQAMTAFAAHMTQRIASSLAREVKESHERVDIKQLNAALHRLLAEQLPMIATEAKN
jgi:glutamyl-tRNA reductase